MTTCNCPHCGGEINPASLLGKGKLKTLTEKAMIQRKNAAAARWAKERAKKGIPPIVE